LYTVGCVMRLQKSVTKIAHAWKSRYKRLKKSCYWLELESFSGEMNKRSCLPHEKTALDGEQYLKLKDCKTVAISFVIFVPHGKMDDKMMH